MPVLRQAIGNFVDNVGGRLGIPETGFSELVAGGKTVNTVAPKAYAPTSPVSSSSPNQTVSPYYMPGGPPSGSYTPTAPSSGGGGGGGGGTPVNPFANLQPQGPSQQEIDSQFNPIFGVLNQAESNLRGQLPGLISEAEAQANASKGLLNNQRSSANELLGQQEVKTTNTQQNQTAQQRQTLQELQLANKQRFGGSSSAGLAAGELQGREFQRNTFQIGQQAQEALQQIGQQRQVVEREFNQGLQQLEVNFQKAKNDINRQFQDKLLEINARRGEAESAKANARMEALQNLRNMAYQIDVSKAQFAAQLQSQAQQNSSYLDNVASQYLSATNQGQGAVDSFASSPQSAIPGVSRNAPQAPSQEMMGQIRRDPRENTPYTGMIQGSSERDPRFQNFVTTYPGQLPN